MGAMCVWEYTAQVPLDVPAHCAWGVCGTVPPECQLRYLRSVHGVCVGVYRRSAN